MLVIYITSCHTVQPQSVETEFIILSLLFPFCYVILLTVVTLFIQFLAYQTIIL